MKNIIKTLIIVCLIVATTLTIYATPGDSIENMDYWLAKSEFERITSDIVLNTGKIDKDLATPEARQRINEFIKNNKINEKSYGKLVDTTLDFTYPEDSSTGDTVVMINAKIEYLNGKYNKLYLFEYHINAEGKIYGFNAWVY